MPIRQSATAWTAAIAALVLLAGCGSSHRQRPSTGGTSVARLFAPGSVWNRALPSNAPLDPRSPELISWLDQQVNHGFEQGPSPYIQTVTDSTTFYTVPADQRMVRVTLDNSAPWARTLQGALHAVPIPTGAQPAAGSDAHMTIWQPSTDRLWELWKAHRTSGGWHASWGGAMRDVSGSPGYYTSRSWPGAAPYWGATATSLPTIAGTMMIDELEQGRIDHALAIALPQARAGEYSWPAQRTDGTDLDPDAIPEGAHLRLDPHLDIAGLHLPPLVAMMARAAQRYGLIVRDKTLSSVAFFAQAPPAGTNPYSSIFGGVPGYDLLKSFPWRHLELLRMTLHRGTGSPS